MARPTFFKLNESFEGWAYRRGFLRTLQRLEREELVERTSDVAAKRIHRLTTAGRNVAMGGRNPDVCWSRPWDRQWRVVSFDLPQSQNTARVRLRRYLRDRNFGYLQKSLWISPDPLEADVKKLSASGEDVESLLTLKAQPCSGESDESIVAGAWDFQHIRQLHLKCLQILKHVPSRQKSRGTAQASSLHRWFRREREAWQRVLRVDPLLPSVLLPDGYLGRKVWRMRNEVLPEALQRLE